MSPAPDLNQWFTVVQTAGIVASLGLSGWAAYRQHRTQQVSTLLRITQSHREIWDELFERPALARVVDPDADLKAHPVEPEERLFVLLLTLHLRAVYEGERSGALRPIWGLGKDIEVFFSAPVPRRVWQDVRDFQDPEFRNFIDAHVRVEASPLHASRV